MPLTAPEILKFRKLTGDTDEQDYSATDAEIDAYYTQAVTDAAADEALKVDPLTVVYLLRQRLGWAINQTDETGEFGNRRNSQIYKNIRDTLLPFWEDLAGLPAHSENGAASMGSVTVGAWSLGTDMTEDDL